MFKAVRVNLSDKFPNLNGDYWFEYFDITSLPTEEAENLLEKLNPTERERDLALNPNDPDNIAYVMEHKDELTFKSIDLIASLVTAWNFVDGTIPIPTPAEVKRAHVAAGGTGMPDYSVVKRVPMSIVQYVADTCMAELTKDKSIPPASDPSSHDGTLKDRSVTLPPSSLKDLPPTAEVLTGESRLSIVPTP